MYIYICIYIYIYMYMYIWKNDNLYSVGYIPIIFPIYFHYILIIFPFIVKSHYIPLHIPHVYIYLYVITSDITYIYIYIWVNYNDLTATSLESWLIREIIPNLPYFRLVNYFNLPIYIYT